MELKYVRFWSLSFMPKLCEYCQEDLQALIQALVWNLNICITFDSYWCELFTFGVLKIYYSS